MKATFRIYVVRKDMYESYALANASPPPPGMPPEASFAVLRFGGGHRMTYFTRTVEDTLDVIHHIMNTFPTGGIVEVKWDNNGDELATALEDILPLRASSARASGNLH